MPSTWTSKAMWKAVLYVAILVTIDGFASFFFYRKTATHLPEVFFQNPEDFDFTPKTFLRKVIGCTMLVPFLYKWQCLLEKWLPSRPHSLTSVQPEKQYEKVEIDEREAEIVQKLIAEGKIQRPSIRWLNTILKCVIDNSIGAFLEAYTYNILAEILKLKSPADIYAHLSRSSIMDSVYECAFDILSPRWLVALLSYIVIPVQHRITFQTGMGVAFNIFLGSAIVALAPWAMSFEIVQDIMRNATLALEEEAKMNGTAVPSKFTIEM